MNNNDHGIDAISVYSLLACWCTQKRGGQTTAWDCCEDVWAFSLTLGLGGIGAQGGLQSFRNVAH
ncbi:hypothetical protein DPMN_018111 [Dreissena polymorpha]|uniref:Uncharacterized protein n=1 Tax=Dreissena polymorpha TaxID=45954 RepID=A0A9D4S8U1_DREPO|nr:hypothetical protein DPMN_018111 [Dreissena polymorpha]